MNHFCGLVYGEWAVGIKVYFDTGISDSEYQGRQIWASYCADIAALEEMPEGGFELTDMFWHSMQAVFNA